MKPSSFNHPGSSRRPPFGLKSSHSSAHSSLRSPLHKRVLEKPLHNEDYITSEFHKSPLPIRNIHVTTPKSSLGNFAMQATGKRPVYKFLEGIFLDGGQRHALWRTIATVELDHPVIGVGDHPNKKESERLAALSVVYQLHSMGILENPRSQQPETQDITEVVLSDGASVNYDRARNFMDYYCRIFQFDKPELTFAESRGANTSWEVQLTVNGRRIGLGSGSSKKAAQIACFLDVVQYLESCDHQLWKQFTEAEKTGADLGLAPKVHCQISDGLADNIRDLCSQITASTLYRNRPVPYSAMVNATPPAPVYKPSIRPEYLSRKSKQLLVRRRHYLADPRMDDMRTTRMALPVYTRSNELLSHIRGNEVTICMAATGSGKTTQIPQLILDDYIDRGDGARCNIICTQPRRLAAISVADRVAKERGELLGVSVGYQVRFEAKPPEEHGSITFCTTGVFLKRLQSALFSSSSDGQSLDDVTHIIVDEVHERDVDTDLLLMVLKRLMADRRARKIPLKVVLMSATIDPTLFQKYFPDAAGKPAKVIEVPGRSFPVEKKFLEDFLPDIFRTEARWILHHDQVLNYLRREVDQNLLAKLGARPNTSKTSTDSRGEDDLEIPYSLLAITISHVIQNSSDGHVLVFLPGWDDIMGTQRALLEPLGPLSINFNDTSKFSIHLLHSTIPLAEQQVIFEPPPKGVRRIILATNIAETSVTIPDVVFVVDTAKIKEQRYDPDRHMSSLVSAWVGSSNLHQRAGRAGRHRPGEYYGLLSRSRLSSLQAYQTVEMKRVDLSNVVMHIKALNFPSMSVEEVLAGTIEPPDSDRVSAAMRNLRMVGALDTDNHLTSLGRVLLQLPVDAQMGRLVLFGSLFRCLDQALTLAAILTNRDPFVSPVLLKKQANEKKNSWTPEEFRSDALATLHAYNNWWALQSNGEYMTANRFCTDNFLSKPTLLLIEKIRRHLLQSLYRAGVIDVSGGGNVEYSTRSMAVPPELNLNGNSLPLLAALIAIASQPKFAIRTGEITYRTPQDKVTFMHPSSVNHRKREILPESHGEKQLIAFAEKRRNLTSGTSAQTFLITTTKLNPMAYMLFGAYKLQAVHRGLECDNWLPIVGRSEYLDNVHRLKMVIDSCMLRVFDGIAIGRRQRKGNRVLRNSREEEPESEDEDMMKATPMSPEELGDLDYLTGSVVKVLDRFHEEQLMLHSRQNSVPATPIASPFLQSLRLGSASGYSTPTTQGSMFSSRPGTPSRLSRCI
ncbi:hypothetical protein AMATHDRAFT_72275 [Amanita thiersii Skay4041]|uniref:P-loop containing nucleoside triphosphate hydrolase protein n=1 Tax=Amanita thiersii Skay4041 TaxID=703135 RepID=A0A2A9NWF2_9AGAR|nr:hypothetical protein AMATHDRAFT_72275 [Amanita thiersii Skay4041]